MTDLKITSKNVLNWLQLLVTVCDVDERVREKLSEYINRTDVSRRDKELEEIFGGEEW